MGRWRSRRESIVRSTPVDRGWKMRSTVDEYLPETLMVIVDIYSNADDMNIIRALDEDGVDVLAELVFDGGLAPEAEESVRAAMLHDINIWLHLNRFDYGSPYRVWMWVRPDEIIPVSPSAQYLYYEKA